MNEYYIFILHFEIINNLESKIRLHKIQNVLVNIIYNLINSNS